MGSSYFVSADRRSDATWHFTAEQLAATVTRVWPGSTLAGDLDDTLDITVRAGEHRCELSYQADLQVLVLRDQDPLPATLAVVHTLLSELAPAVPAVRWADFDASPEPLDLTAGPDRFVEDFGA
ncbi:hypothetical protein OG689_11580 [Kitasatospora sp. NBC_00240]|uniref:hypothetical protein n=1 Tax=Kitasatospora sp. NBC_00240 TaxID=2903567 RepID=UPI002257A5FB|nr:hypothetical protein [Kitasatospora sp. NBC_00240]MCX5209925.1 hypothetical protein [Kitasatospora sp. NBC_00240]